MKKLQRHFTTPEQSRRLLKLGVPANSADMYYVSEFENLIWNRNTKGELSDDFFDALINGKSINTPIWSVGRLIEIYLIASDFKKIGYEIYNYTDFINSIIEDIELGVNDGIIDFSKLEE